MHYIFLNSYAIKQSMETEQTIIIKINNPDEISPPIRLDNFLTKSLPPISRNQIQKLIESGFVLINGEKANKSAYLSLMDVIQVSIPKPKDTTHQPQDIPLNILFEDVDILVLDKPAGLVVHPAAGNPDHTLVNALLSHCGNSLSSIGGEKRPGIVHRLDKDSSGIMVIAKNNFSHQQLAQQFEKHTIERKYIAFGWGVLNKPSGLCEGYIARSKINRKKMTLVKNGGKYMCTHYRLLNRFLTLASKIECTLKTGRTHQVRLHMQSLTHPLIGDKVYGRVKNLGEKFHELDLFLKGFQRHALHAFHLSFEHPITKQVQTFNSPLPPEMAKLEEILEKLNSQV